MKKALGWLVSAIAFGTCFYLAREGVHGIQTAAAPAPSTQPGLSGDYRDGFVGAAIRTCTETQTKAPENANISKTILTGYCVCFANGMADRISDATLKSLDVDQAADRPARMKSVIDAAARACIKEVEAALAK
jgi:hypothetical protein